jgi:hypothetical protein
MLHKKFGEYDGHLDKAEAVWYIEYARARHFPGEIPRKWSQDHFLPACGKKGRLIVMVPMCVFVCVGIRGVLRFFAKFWIGAMK